MAFVPINKSEHAGLRVRASQSYRYAAPIAAVPIVPDELALIAAYYPIAFARFTEGGRPVPAAVLGLSQGRNLFVSPAGRWRGGYIPAVLRRYPFLLAPAQEEGQFAVCVDQDSDLLNEEEGERFFEEDGSQTAYLTRLTDFLIRVQGQLQRMERIGALLDELDLLQPITLRLPSDRPSPDEAMLSPLRQINEITLNGLDEADFMRLRNEGALPVAYAQLATSGQWERLAELAMLAKGEAHGSQPAEPPASKQAPPEGEDWVLSFD